MRSARLPWREARAGYAAVVGPCRKHHARRDLDFLVLGGHFEVPQRAAVGQVVNEPLSQSVSIAFGRSRCGVVDLADSDHGAIYCARDDRACLSGCSKAPPGAPRHGNGWTHFWRSAPAPPAAKIACLCRAAGREEPGPEKAGRPRSNDNHRRMTGIQLALSINKSTEP